MGIHAALQLMIDRSAAAAADTALARGDDVGPLHGLPVAHKDLVLTRNIRTSFGSRVLEHFVPDQDALLVERLRAAVALACGMVPLADGRDLGRPWSHKKDSTPWGRSPMRTHKLPFTRARS